MSKELRRFFWCTIKKAAWAPISVFLVMVVFLIFNIFILFPDIDIPMHIIGGVAIAYFYNVGYLIAKKNNLIGQPSEFLQLLTVLSLVVTTTVLWEFTEYATDHIIGSYLQGDLNDTLLDMLMGIVGVFLFLVLTRFKTKK